MLAAFSVAFFVDSNRPLQKKTKKHRSSPRPGQMHELFGAGVRFLGKVWGVFWAMDLIFLRVVQIGHEE